MLTSAFLFVIQTNNAQTEFTIDWDRDCAPATMVITYTGTDNSGNSYQWYIQDSIYTVKNPQHLVLSPGYIDVYLQVVDTTGGGSSFVTVDSYGEQVYGLVIRINGSRYSNVVCAGQPLEFSASGNGSNIDSVKLGDGTTIKNKNNFSHTYASNNDYTLEIFYSSDDCGMDTIYKLIKFGNSNFNFQEADINLDENHFYYCPQEEAVFSLINATKSSADSIFWDFGDGSTEITTDHGNFNIENSHKYTQVGEFEVSARLKSLCGNDTTLTTSIEVTNDVELEFYEIYFEDTICIEDKADFYVSSNSSINGTTYTWDFGDGKTAVGTSNTIKHKYAATGKYTITVFGENLCGKKDTFEVEVVVSNTGSFLADFDLEVPEEACPGDELIFALYEYDDRIVSVLWEFDTIATSTDKTKHFTFENVGEYQITLTLTSFCGATYSVDYTVDINESITDFDFSLVDLSEENESQGYCIEDSIQIIYVIYDGVVPAEISVDFGDGSAAVTEHKTVNIFGREYILISHVYAALGEYSIDIELTNGCDYSEQFEDILKINIIENVEINDFEIEWDLGPPNYDEDSVEIGQTVYFYQYYGGQVTWNFGDGTSLTSSAFLVSHVFTTKNTYNVVATITNGCGNSAKDSVSVEVFEPINISVQNQSNNFDFNLYPNPTKSSFTVNLPADVNSGTLEILDNIGRKVKSMIVKDLDIVQCSDLNKGLYFVRISSVNGLASKTLIIE